MCLFKLRQITSRAGQKTSHSCGSPVITPGTFVLWQPHSGTALAAGFSWGMERVSCWSFQQGISACQNFIQVWEDELFFVLCVPGSRLSSYHENTNQWLTEMVITKSFSCYITFPTDSHLTSKQPPFQCMHARSVSYESTTLLPWIYLKGQNWAKNQFRFADKKQNANTGVRKSKCHSLGPVWILIIPFFT